MMKYFITISILCLACFSAQATNLVVSDTELIVLHDACLAKNGGSRAGQAECYQAGLKLFLNGFRLTVNNERLIPENVENICRPFSRADVIQDCKYKALQSLQNIREREALQAGK